jgi:methylenetetrahydrofolate dehydrogenase (NADP+) / methenyltetrahydrofolate cyclohydrolase
MLASLLDGLKVASTIKEQVKHSVNQRLKDGIRPPKLAVVLVGQDPASQVYVNNKRKACAAMGFDSQSFDLESSVSEEQLLQIILGLNEDPSVDGILVQLPLPDHINAKHIIEHIHPQKDVDGFHPYNFGRLAQGNPLLRPCTPFGIMTMLDYYELPVKGKHAVVVGASKIVGRPMALELLLANATVTVCHRSTRNLEDHVRAAEILVVATGQHGSVSTDWLNHNQVVIDVGIHRDEQGKLKGDIDFEHAKEKVAWITPVPGGVGPMTIATLLSNTLLAAELNQQKAE